MFVGLEAFFFEEAARAALISLSNGEGSCIVQAVRAAPAAARAVVLRHAGF